MFSEGALFNLPGCHVSPGNCKCTARHVSWFLLFLTSVTSCLMEARDGKYFACASSKSISYAGRQNGKRIWHCAHSILLLLLSPFFFAPSWWPIYARHVVCVKFPFVMRMLQDPFFSRLYTNTSSSSHAHADTHTYTHSLSCLFCLLISNHSMLHTLLDSNWLRSRYSLLFRPRPASVVLGGRGLVWDRCVCYTCAKVSLLCAAIPQDAFFLEYSMFPFRLLHFPHSHCIKVERVWGAFQDWICLLNSSRTAVCDCFDSNNEEQSCPNNKLGNEHGLINCST